VKRPETKAFKPQAFLANVGTGKTVLNYRTNSVIFAQGDVADRVFYIQAGKVKLTVVSEQERRPSSASSGPSNFWVKDV
jgi:CRP/FNR family transcriptional regulator, cyclic AMP receptor protein